MFHDSAVLFRYAAAAAAVLLQHQAESSPLLEKCLRGQLRAANLLDTRFMFHDLAVLFEYAAAAAAALLQYKAELSPF